MNDHWELCETNLLRNMNKLIRRVISASFNGKQIITQKEFLVDELTHIAMERAQLYNAKLFNILRASQFEDERSSKAIFIDLPQEKR